MRTKVRSASLPCRDRNWPACRPGPRPRAEPPSSSRRRRVVVAASSSRRRRRVVVGCYRACGGRAPIVHLSCTYPAPACCSPWSSSPPRRPAVVVASSSRRRRRAHCPPPCRLRAHRRARHRAAAVVASSSRRRRVVEPSSSVLTAAAGGHACTPSDLRLRGTLPREKTWRRAFVSCVDCSQGVSWVRSPRSPRGEDACMAAVSSSWRLFPVSPGR